MSSNAGEKSPVVTALSGSDDVERVAKVFINGEALQHNLKRVKAYAPDSRVMAVIKANAYGHGALNTAHLLSEADAFALAMPGEAIKLRKAGITKPLITLQGFSSMEELNAIAVHDIQPVIHQLWQIDLLEKLEQHCLTVWLKVDTGMHRLGVSIDEVEHAYLRLSACATVKQVNIMSHFANADDPENVMNENQLSALQNLSIGINAERSMANSAAIIAFPSSQLDWVRPGIMLYGSSPFPSSSAEDYGLQPVMSFESTLLAVKQLKKGDLVGYGSSWRCPQDMSVGIVAAGYADGYPRHAKSGTPVWINGFLCPLVGRVSMDSLCVDLRVSSDGSSQVKFKSGDRVVLWGKELSVDTIAESAGTIGYELLCQAGNAAA